MKNKIKIVFYLVLVSISIHAQSGGVTSIEEIPKYNLPTPEAFKFAKYGEIPVNESSGNANVSIPLFNFEAGKIVLPISISHSGGAVKVDEDNTWTGINWQLNAGGIITRVVNDRVDEKCASGQRIFYSSTQLHNFIPGQSEELIALGISTIDSEVDIFNYNFNGNSGSFYLDENLVPKLIKYDKELKIELSSDPTVNGVLTLNKRTIIITTSDGTKYFFGGVNASETTRLRQEAHDFTESAQTSFYLFKMENIYKDIINFNYKVGGTSYELIGFNQEYNKDIAIEGISSCSPQLKSGITARRPYYLESSGKLILSSITYNRGLQKVVFESTFQSETSINRFRLNNIALIDENNRTIKNATLNYVYPNNINWFYKRFFLENIEFKNGFNNEVEKLYSFEYNSPELLPERFSFSQDYGGYYNGKNNTNYVPKVYDPAYGLGDLVDNLADKTVVFTNASYGSLKKVIYPTKGFTEFEYESGIDNTISTYEKETRYLNIYHNNPATNNTNLHFDSTNSLNTEFDNNVSYLSSILNPTRPIKVNISGEVDGYLTQHHFVKFILDDMDSSNDVVKTIPLENPSGMLKYINISYEFTNLNPNGRYTFRLEYYRTSTTNYPNFLKATAQIVFETNTPIINFKPGIRIKRIRSYAFTGASPIITRYYYNKAAEKNQPIDSEVIVKFPRYTGDAIQTGACWTTVDSNGWTWHMPYTVFKKKIYSNTQNNIYISENNRSIYQYVTVSYGGDNFETGGKQTTFFVQQDIPLSSLTAYGDTYISDTKVSNNSLKNGTILNEIYFKNNPTFGLNSEIISGKVKEITNTYITIPEKSSFITNCYSSKLFEKPIAVALPALYIDNYYFGYYYTYSWWHTLESTITKEYFNNDVIETQQNFYYDSKLAGLPSRVLKILGTDIKEIKMSYPSDLLSQSEMIQLNTQFRIDQPIETKEFLNGTLLTQRNIKYSIYNNIPNNYYVLPSSIQTLKNESTPIAEDRILFHRYDDYGNPVEISKSDGLHVVYIWGYNNSKPIAKIENATYSQVQSYISNLQTLSNGSDEQGLIIALNNLRNVLPNSMVTSYTYKSLIGLSTITDPKGDKVTYHYDNNNRLLYVKDANGNILSENAYNYKN